MTLSELLQRTQGLLPSQKREIFVKLANQAQKYFVSSWRKQGWDGQQWKEPKRKSAKKQNNWTRKPTLIQRGTLRRAVSNMVSTANYNTDGVRMVVDSKYAAVHNYGGIISKKATTRQVEFKVNMRSGKSRFAKKGKGNFAQDINFGAHTITMPKRQFVGQTNELTKKQERLIKQELNKIFKK